MSTVVVTDTTAIPPMGLPPGDPTFDGFKWFVSHIMAVPGSSMPDDSWLLAAYDQSLNLTYLPLAGIPSQSDGPSIYAFAVYNLGCAILCDYAQDDPNDPNNTFWTSLRNTFGLNSMSLGLITSAADQGTSESTYIPEQIKGLTLMGLQLLKTPWGRQYLAITGQWGTIWGLTI